jgi:lysophospholipid acyltransferase (LPLAT)-like uncharacterized protein
MSDPWSRFLIAVAPPLIAAALRLLYATVRIEYVNADTLLGRWARGERTIVTFWHNRVLLMPRAYTGRQMCIMNSLSRDGEIATRALARLGIDSVRGSASRGGATGFLQLVHAFRRGSDLAVVPDGPRGPRYVAKVGVIHLARLTGAPLFPATYAVTRFRQLGSWDRLIVPLPFARAAVVVGEPLEVARDADATEVERLRLELESRLNRITEDAERRADAFPR